jgi:hypothetical protein
MATANQAATINKKTRAPRKAKTAAELKAELEKAKAEVARFVRTGFGVS